MVHVRARVHLSFFLCQLSSATKAQVPPPRRRVRPTEGFELEVDRLTRTDCAALRFPCLVVWWARAAPLLVRV